MVAAQLMGKPFGGLELVHPARRWAACSVVVITTRFRGLVEGAQAATDSGGSRSAEAEPRQASEVFDQIVAIAGGPLRGSFWEFMSRPHQVLLT
jgi:hypothetical protein